MSLTCRAADPTLADADGRMPLHWAAFNDEAAALRMLLAVPGVDRDAADGRGRTALDLALENDAEAAAQMLQAMQP